MPETTSFDFDLTSSDLSVGLEVEYPGMNSSDEKYVNRGRGTSGIQSEMHGLPSHIGGRPVYDGTVGLEIVSDILNPVDARGWFEDVIDYVREEYNTDYQPTGLMGSGNTAGLHVHISDLNNQQARTLFELSQEPWMKVLFCSSIANEDGEATWPVFRGGRYCQMNFDDDRYSCINYRGGGHYEWRMPEPMTPGNVEIMMRFLSLFEEDPDLAVQYAQELLDSGDDRITAIKRADATGMDIIGEPTVAQEPASSDPEGFYEAVADEWAAPNIYTVRLDEAEFYLLDSDLQGEFAAAGQRVHTNDVLYADSLEPVEDNTIRGDVESAFERRHASNNRETPATEELKKVIKKKKGKA